MYDRLSPGRSLRHDCHSAAAHLAARAGGVNSVGWLFWPQGMTAVLLRVRDAYTRTPLYITETGWAFDDYVDPAGDVKDLRRIAFLDGYLPAAHAAIAQGVNLRGPIIWCFSDNVASSAEKRP